LRLPIADNRVDVRDDAAVRAVFVEAQPEMVFHLAAQPLVRRSYREPVATWATNVMGTAHVLDAVLHTPATRAAVVVTSDKCYHNRELVGAYREHDRLGGHDPYSASKAGAELVAASYRHSFFGRPDAPLIATARAGNVIGGGDWSEDRLVPDLVRAVAAGESLVIRSPLATRPWQHVLDCLSGYLLLGRHLLDGDSACAEAWNFGPNNDGNRTVEQVLTSLALIWPQVRWEQSTESGPYEAGLLQLDAAKAGTRLGWRPVWAFGDAIAATAHWYQRWLQSGEVCSAEELATYVADAAAAGHVWAQG
jgi:CDP-glucose 4,6-dehydratase